MNLQDLAIEKPPVEDDHLFPKVPAFFKIVGLKHLAMSPKSTILLNNALSAMEMNEIHLLNWGSHYDGWFYMYLHDNYLHRVDNDKVLICEVYAIARNAADCLLLLSWQPLKLVHLAIIFFWMITRMCWQFLMSIIKNTSYTSIKR